MKNIQINSYEIFKFKKLNVITMIIKPKIDRKESFIKLCKNNNDMPIKKHKRRALNASINPFSSKHVKKTKLKIKNIFCRSFNCFLKYLSNKVKITIMILK